MKLDTYIEPDDSPRRHPFLPKDFRLLIAGKSGSGKTTILMNLLLQPLVDFDKVWIYTTTKEQPMMQELKKRMKAIEEYTQYPILEFMDHIPSLGHYDVPIPQLEGERRSGDGKRKRRKRKKKKSDFSDSDSEEEEEKPRHIVVFDDVMGESREAWGRMSEHFTTGRHKGLSCVILVQSYFDVPRKLRQQLSHLCCFKPPEKNYEGIIERAWGLKKGTFEKLGDRDFLCVEKATTSVTKNLDEPLSQETSSSSSSETDSEEEEYT